MKRAARLALVASSFLAFVGFADPAGALPAFARRYSLSCAMCHAPFPRLTAFGEEFAGRGFRMASADAEPASASVDTGDDTLQLLKSVPIALRLEGFGAYREAAASEVDFETPWVFKVLSGGPISRSLSYYMYFIIEQGEVVGLEDAFLQQRLFGGKSYLVFGQFQVSDPLFKRELRLERSDYEIYRVRIGEARANLTYDRGLMFLSTLPGGVDMALEVVSGNGIPSGEFDKDNKKNFALRLSRHFGQVRIGLFGYLGKEEAGVSPATNALRYFGPDLTFSVGERWELNAQYLERRDDNPLFLSRGAAEFTTQGGFVELLFFPQGAAGKWSLAALYNQVDSDDPAAVGEDLAFTLGYLTARNVKVVAEAGRDLEVKRNRLSVGLVTAF
jgi:hypothetical protein